MTYQVARAHLATVVAAVAVDADTDVGPSTLTHAPDAGGNVDDVKKRTRTFWFETNVGGIGRIVGPYVPDISQQPRTIATVDLIVYYLDIKGQRSRMDFNIEDDARAIARALLTTSNYGVRATTNVDYVEDVVWRREILQNDDVALRMTMTLHYI